MDLRFNYFRKLNKDLLEYIKEDFGVDVKLGAEVEFYLRLEEDLATKEILNELAKKCMRIENEKGWHQYECVFSHDGRVEDLHGEMWDLRFFTTLRAKQYDGKALFKAKPFEKDYGSALHIHASLHDKDGKNLLGDEAYERNIYIQKAITGLLDLARESTYLLCHTEDDFKRFEPGFLAPTHIAWGGNNRTTMLRIPDSDPEERRIEYRLPPASCDPGSAIFCCLLGIYHGLNNNFKPIERTWGNAHDGQYKLEKLPHNLENAKNAFEKGGKIIHYIKQISNNPPPEFIKEALSFENEVD